MEEFIGKYDEYLTINSDPINTWITRLENNELVNEKTNYLPFFKMVLSTI